MQALGLPNVYLEAQVLCPLLCLRHLWLPEVHLLRLLHKGIEDITDVRGFAGKFGVERVRELDGWFILDGRIGRERLGLGGSCGLREWDIGRERRVLHGVHHGGCG